MDIKKSIEQTVNQNIERAIDVLENEYIAFLVGNEVIKVKVKLDAKISSVEFDTDSKEPVVVDLVRELNEDYVKPASNHLLRGRFYGSKSNPMLQIDDRYFLCMVGMPHQVTRLEYNKELSGNLKYVCATELSDGDWVLKDVNSDMFSRSVYIPSLEDFALVYRDELYFWNFSQVEHEPIVDVFYFKLIFE